MNQQTAYSIEIESPDFWKYRKCYINTLESKFTQGLIVDDDVYDIIQALKSDLQLIKSLTKITDDPIRHLVYLDTKEFEQNLKSKVSIEKIERTIRLLKAVYVSICIVYRV